MTSLGNRSGVNWMRPTEPPTLAAKALASVVLPTPGTSSRSTCPSASTVASVAVIAESSPESTVEIDGANPRRQLGYVREFLGVGTGFVMTLLRCPSRAYATSRATYRTRARGTLHGVGHNNANCREIVVKSSAKWREVE